MTIRAFVDLLRANGHADPELYPLGYLYDEAAIIRQRVNSFLVTNAVLTQTAVAALLSPREGTKAFNDLIKRLTNGR